LRTLLSYRCALYAYLLYLLAVSSVQAGSIAVIVTRDAEMNMLCEGAQTQEEYAVIADRPVYACVCGSNTLHAVKARPGLVNAALSAQMMIDHFNPELLISIGLCAAVNDDIPVGTVVPVGGFDRYDVGTYTDAGFMHGTASYRKTRTTPELKVQDPSAWAVLIDRLKAGNENLREGILATGAGFIRSRYKRMWIRKKLGADIVDMSGAAVQDVAQDNAVPGAP
jgi:adenosylhomocysteine nucleosidase